MFLFCYLLRVAVLSSFHIMEKLKFREVNFPRAAGESRADIWSYLSTAVRRSDVTSALGGPVTGGESDSDRHLLDALLSLTLRSTLPVSPNAHTLHWW